MMGFAIAVLGLMAVANYWVGRRLLYPPVVFCSVWAADLFLLRLAGSFFYPLADDTLAIFCLGALAISIGSAIGLMVPERVARYQTLSPTKSSERILNVLLLVVLCSAPFVLLWIAELASNFDVASFLLAARMAMLEADQSGDPSASLSGNIATLSIIIAMIAYLHYETGKKRAFLAIAIALLLNIAGGSRAGIVGLLLSIACIDSITNRRVRWKPMLAIFLALVLISGALAIGVQKGEARADAPLAENLVPVVEGFVSYAAGGIVAFDRVVREPNIIQHNWQISTVALQTANKMGAKFDVPSTNAEFVDVGPGDLSQNVYTIYFAYSDLGIAGMMLPLSMVGLIVTLIYRRAIGGSKVSIVLYSFCFAGLLLSPYAEYFFMGLNFSIKIFAVAWLVYDSPTRAKQLVDFLVRIKPERAYP